MIAPMKKVSVVCMKEDRERILTALQHSALMMITASDTGTAGGDRDSSEKQRRIEQLLRELSVYGKKKGLLDQPPEVSESDFDTVSSETVVLCEKLEKTIEKRDSAIAEINNLNATLLSILDWEPLKVDADDLKSTESSEIITGRIPLSDLSVFEEGIKDVGAAFEMISQNEKTAQVLIVCFKDSAQELRSRLLDCSFEDVRLPLEKGTVAERISEIKERLATLEDEKAQLEQQLSDVANVSKTDVETLFEQYRSRTDRAEVRLDETAETVFIEGWVRADCMEKLEKTIAQTCEVYGIEARDPFEDEDVPTSLTNSKTVSQFEGITEMFNPPKYGDFDPNTVMAPWYWVIFGMMMGDAGYGLMMAVLIFIGKKLLRPKGGTEKLMNVLLYSSITTIIFGILFGSYFGDEIFPAVLPFTAMGDPIKMLLLTIIVGVLHIFTGMITKMVLDIKNGRPLDAVFDQLSWMMVISGIGMIFLKPVQKIGMGIAVAGALIILFTAGRSKKGIFGKIAGGLGGLYNITSYFSDILSYSRILALSLATGVVGMVMNMLAEMVQGNVIGFVFSILIYIVGHIFNLVLGLLSAYVHACRLQYIEFYGKFYEGGGTIFKPFSIKTNYINIKKD